MPDEEMSLGAAIGEFRRRAGLSQAALAEAMHLTVRHIRRLEHGYPVSPQLLRLFARLMRGYDAARDLSFLFSVRCKKSEAVGLVSIEHRLTLLEVGVRQLAQQRDRLLELERRVRDLESRRPGVDAGGAEKGESA
jgi:transcriptional regulator with XRE-family HTH domain